jgi:hypothetical protein
MKSKLLITDDLFFPKKFLRNCSENTHFSLSEWLDKEYRKEEQFADIEGDPAENPKIEELIISRVPQ